MVRAVTARYAVECCYAPTVTIRVPILSIVTVRAVTERYAVECCYAPTVTIRVPILSIVTVRAVTERYAVECCYAPTVTIRVPILRHRCLILFIKHINSHDSDRLHYLSILDGLQEDDKLSCGSYDLMIVVLAISNDLYVYRPTIGFDLDRLIHAEVYAYISRNGVSRSWKV